MLIDIFEPPQPAISRSEIEIAATSARAAEKATRKAFMGTPSFPTHFLRRQQESEDSAAG